jgi:uncharacterized membrane protein YeiH
VGATVFVLLEQFTPGAPGTRFIGVGTTLILRLAAIQWRLSLPVFQR